MIRTERSSKCRQRPLVSGSSVSEDVYVASASVGVTPVAVITLVVASWADLFAGEGASIAELFSGGLPQVLPQFLPYALYRWEAIIRTTIIVGFVPVVGVDVVSAGLRRLAR